MKNKILFSAMLCLACTFSVTVNAQLEVMSSGDVKASQDVEIVGKVQIQDSLYVEKSAEIKRNLKIRQDVSIGDAIVDDYIGLNVIKTANGTDNPYYGIKSQATIWTSMPTSSIYGIHSVADANPASFMISGQSIVGIYGMCIKGSNKPTHFAAGVAGIANYYGGYGIYGGIGTDRLPSSMSSGGLYAGYFNGTTIVNGTLTATTISTTSDERQKENIQTISSKSAENIQLLTPVSYTLKQDSTWKYDKEATELQGVHYGLIAQEVQKVFPELVYERGGQLSINYIELIPLLILEVQKLSAEVEVLKDINYTISTNQSPEKKSSKAIDTILFQNNPNPFDIDTEIKYVLPSTTKQAVLNIYDLNGLQIAEHPIYTFGHGSIILSAGSLDAGMYLYSLVADGQVVDTKRMILTK